MSAAPSQLAELHRQLTENFSSHQTISIVPVKGNPPEKYEITYNINGLNKSEGGGVVEATGHVVELSIPFGFPHFPPSCKPKSPIFHPDFDPAAICLGDFWQQDSELSALIIYIGRMINGEFYSSSNAFNEEACIWYRNNPEALPLAEVKWLVDEVACHAAEKGVEKTGESIDILDESDLSMKFDFLAIEEIEEEVLSDKPPPAADPAPAVDPDLLTLLEKQRRFYALRESIKNCDIGTLSEDLRKLSLRSEKEVARAEELFREARKHEKQNDIHSALGALEKIAGSVVDFPELEDQLGRLRQILADRESKKSVSPSVSITDQLAGEEKRSAKDIGRKGKGPPTAARKAARSRPFSNKKIAGFLAVGLVAAFSAGCGYYYWTGTAKLGNAASAFARCTDLLEKDLFQEAQRSCVEAQTISEAVKFIHRDRLGELRAQIGRTLESEKMRQGLKGMILVEGRYLSLEDAEMQESFRRFSKEAEEFFLQEKWRPAIEHYDKILAMPETPHIIAENDVAEVKAKHGFAQFRLVYDAALQTLQNGRWQQAATDFNKAEGLLILLPEDHRQRYGPDLRKARATAAFEQAREQGDHFFAGSQWQEAMSAYELALATPGIDFLPKESLEAIHTNVKRAALYDLIDQGIKAFGAGAWDEAIGDYRQAEEFLANHQIHLNSSDTEKSLKKLSRIILQALIVRDRQLAAELLQKEELQAAVDIYRQLIKQIDNSPFSQEDEFRAAGEEFAATVQALDEKIFLAEKSKYLENEYRQLFAAHYPTAVRENLVNPVISFSKDIGGKTVFKMQCTETGGGRPLTLVMYYAFDRRKGQWELHSEPQ